jgi:hypothetical protein
MRKKSQVSLFATMMAVAFSLHGASHAAELPGEQAQAPTQAAPGATAPEQTTRAPIVDPRAAKLVMEMGKYLNGAEQFSFQAQITFDDVLPSGQTVQFAATEDIAVRRPNDAYIEYAGDLGSKQFWYNGATITLYDPDKNMYASEKVPPNLDQAMDYVMKQFGFSPPLSDLLYSDPDKELMGKVVFGVYIGPSVVDGVRCQHLAFLEKYIDWQIWIEDGKQLLPRKLLITYKTIPSEASPQTDEG